MTLKNAVWQVRSQKRLLSNPGPRRALSVPSSRLTLKRVHQLAVPYSIPAQRRQRLVLRYFESSSGTP